jgi:hypothetical protein
MTYLVRVYEDPEYATWTDTEHVTQPAAYAQLWQDAIPLPLDTELTTVQPAPWGFAIADQGVWIHSSRPEIVGQPVA